MSASFVYDAFGRRMGKSIGRSVTQFLYDGMNPVQELNGASPPTPTANLTGLNIDEYFRRTDARGTASFLTDALGSTIALANSAGAITTNYTYEPFGNATASGAANANSFQFTGRENDATGLYYYRARYYSPTYQRFISQDPAGFLNGYDLYSYTMNDPVRATDPFGLWVFGIGFKVSGGTAGAGGSVGKQLVIDGEGDVGIATTECFGGATTVGAAGGYLTGSYSPDASTINDIGGNSLDTGSDFPGGGISLSTGKHVCANGSLGPGAGLPPVSLDGEGCHTTVAPLQWAMDPGPVGPFGGPYGPTF